MVGRCIAYFIHHCWNDLLVLYLESLDLPLKNVVEGSTNLHFPDAISYIAFSSQKVYQSLILNDDFPTVES